MESSLLPMTETFLLLCLLFLRDNPLLSLLLKENSKLSPGFGAFSFLEFLELSYVLILIELISYCIEVCFDLIVSNLFAFASNEFN